MTSGKSSTGRRRRRRAQAAASAAPPTEREAETEPSLSGAEAPADQEDETAPSMSERAAPDPPPARRPASPKPRSSSAALIAVLLFAWGLSLLAFDAARREVFEPQGRDHVLLVVPIFAGAVVAGLLALLMRRLGRRPVGGAVMHRFGLASGLLGVSAIVLAVSLGPRVRQAERLSRELRAERLLEGLALALERHRAERGGYPPVVGMQSLAAALTPEYLKGPLPAFDPWGNPIWYQSFGSGEGYLLLSVGPDGTQSLPVAAYLSPPSREALGDDIVVVSGRFVALGGAP